MISLDGQSLSSSLIENLRLQVLDFQTQYDRSPGLAVILVGDNPSSQIYVKHKIKQCSKVGFHSVLKHFPADVKISHVKKQVKDFNRDSNIHGILIQLPLPNSCVPEEILSVLDPKKDVDGLTLENKSLLWSGQPRVVPCTPLGVIKLLKHYQIPIEAQKAVVVGRSQIVGLPMAQLMLLHHSTVTICHSKTRIQHLKQECRQADIVIACAGQKGLLNKEFFKKGAVVVDIGIHREIKNNKTHLKGDVSVEGLTDILYALSPVPGGVGPMTIAMLLENTFYLANRFMES